MVFIVEWSKIPGFGVQWPKANRGKSWMAKNGLYSAIAASTSKLCCYEDVSHVSNGAEMWHGAMANMAWRVYPEHKETRLLYGAV